MENGKGQAGRVSGLMWVCRVDLKPGKYLYKFIVDDSWIVDPANSTTETDERGNINSMLVKSGDG